MITLKFNVDMFEVIPPILIDRGMLIVSSEDFVFGQEEQSEEKWDNKFQISFG